MKGNFIILSIALNKMSCLSEVIIFSLGKHKGIGMPTVLCRDINTVETKRNFFALIIFLSPIKNCIKELDLIESLDLGHILIRNYMFAYFNKMINSCFK